MSWTEKNMPQNFNEDERATLLALIDNGRQSLLPYDGDWKANWLLTDVFAPTWLIRTNETRFVDGVWKRALTLHWHAKLADGSLLTDPENSYILETAQRAAFLVRFLAGFGVDSGLALQQWCSRMITICQWMFVNERLFAPKEYAFARLDTAAINDFISKYVAGGKANVLNVPARCLDFFYRESFGSSPPSFLLNDIFKVTEKDKQGITTWLESKGYFTRKNNDRNWYARYIDRAMLAESLACGWQEIKSDRMNAFLRQFEPEMLLESEDLLLPINGYSTEFPGHWTREREAVSKAPMSYTMSSAMLSTWRDLFRLRRHLLTAVPMTETIDFSHAKHIVEQKSSAVERTPWVPLRTALAYTTEALRWTVNSGDALVDFYIEATQHFHRAGWFNEDNDTPKIRERKRESRNKWVCLNIPQELDELGISGWTSVFIANATNVHCSLRASPSLPDILQVLVGALILLIGITKPSRVSEIRALRRDCLKFVEGDGYWMEHQIRKANASDHLIETAKPIPTITAHAIRLLGRIGDALSDIYPHEDSYATEALFYLPIFRVTGAPRPRVIDSPGLIACLEAFCDYVALAPDAHGRRWYVRPHELRKSFLITFFWCFKYSSLDAARWIAGHDNTQHIYAYIEANFPGEELPQLEAEYAARQLREWGITKEADEGENIDILHTAVCEHFGVRDVTLVGERELEDWLELAFAKGIYRIEPYEIHSKSDSVKVVIAFHVEEVAEDGA
ncbi:hypothetical protein JF541_15585 [Marinobacter hydrocarbonoclasticus]|uniref:hypothetical protein n=1 Tax=Marinobacter nauticus TaxID=2743 RepID=UPI001A8F9BC6|nr:hypothetical protein [Marinobacter nauticus]MBN8240582.1 hypothetical protein [Marinobacter nauticus]